MPFPSSLNRKIPPFINYNQNALTGDFNSYTTQGVYYSDMIQSMTHKPVDNDNGYLIVMSRGSSVYVKQLWVSCFTDDIYSRHRASGTWSSWKLVSVGNKEITITKDTTVYNSGGLTAYRNGNNVCVSLVGVTVKSAGTNMILATGLPIPANGDNSGYAMNIPWSATDISTRYQVYVDGSGNLTVNAKSTSAIYVTLNYICA